MAEGVRQGQSGREQQGVQEERRPHGVSEEDKEVNNNQEPAAEKGQGEDTTEHGGNDVQQVSDIEIDDELLHEPDD